MEDEGRSTSLAYVFVYCITVSIHKTISRNVAQLVFLFYFLHSFTFTFIRYVSVIICKKASNRLSKSNTFLNINSAR